MKLRGRRHWTERITVLAFTGGGPDPDNPTGRANLQAAVQSTDRESILKAGLETTQEHWWIRIEPGARVTQQANRIRWHSSEGNTDLEITSVNAIPGEDIELTVTRAP